MICAERAEWFRIDQFCFRKQTKGIIRQSREETDENELNLQKKISINTLTETSTVQLTMSPLN